MNRLIIDASSILRAAHHAGNDVEYGYTVQFEGKPVKVNSAQWAFDSFMASYSAVLERMEVKTAPYQTILVLDGQNSRSLRASIWPEYKAHRPPRAPELNVEFNKALGMVKAEIMALGGAVAYQDGYEADDVIAYLAQNLRGDKTVWCRDKDMLALVSDSVHVLYGNEIDPWIHNCCPPEFVCVYKALAGDTSDGYKGATGFRERAFENLATMFGIDGLAEVKELIEQRRLHELADNVGDLKALQKVIDSAKDVYTSYALAKFYPDRIDDLQVEMRIATVSHPAVRQWHQTKRLATPADTDWMLAEIRKSPYVALDIETDTPLESKEWAQKIIDASNGRRKVFVDVMGSYLCGMSLTFGENLQHTVYMSARHKGTNPWTVAGIVSVVAEIPETTPVVIHNVAFELPVIFNECGAWIENAVDTALMSSYADENLSMGLKDNSKHYFGYEQTTYEQVTTKEGPVGTLPEGGKHLSFFQKELGDLSALEISAPEDAISEQWERRQYGMAELTAAEVFDYGCDDTICTAALYNRLMLTMELEGTVDVFRRCEIATSYALAEAYVSGIEFDEEVLKDLSLEDKAHFAEQWGIVKEYLAEKGWRGTKYIPFERTVAGVKKAFISITGRELETRVRKEDKLLEAVRENGCPELADAIESEDEAAVDELLLQYWEANPEFDVKKSADLVKLMYETMDLPIRFRAVPTELMRAKGIREGNPQADFAAVEHAIQLDLLAGSAEHRVLIAIREMKACLTREGLFYSAWPLYKHWKTGKVHMNFGQSRASTRRLTPNSPNGNQLPKKNEGKKVRRIVKAPPGYILCTLDLAGQELKLAAWQSQDPTFLSCYIGDQLRDLHSLTGSAIAGKAGLEISDYFKFVELEGAGDKDAKAYRAKGKAVNFATQFLVQSKKLGKMLIVTPEEAQVFIDAKNETYPGLVDWQKRVIAEMHKTGLSWTPLGALRHFKEKLASGDKWEVAEAERQAVNFRIQSAGAEQVKLAISAMYNEGVFEEFRIRLVTPVHDELVSYIPIENAVAGIRALHERMVRQYADMKIPAESEISIGWNFGQLVKVGKYPTEAAILSALTKLQETL